VAFLVAAALSLAGSIAADALVVAIGTRVFPSTRGYPHFRFSDYGTLTVVGVLVACAAWPVVTRVTSAPRWLFFRLAILVTLVAWLPDVWLLVIRHEPARAVSVLAVMHLAIGVVTYNLLTRVAPVRWPLPRREPTQPAPSGEPLGTAPPKPSRRSPLSGRISVRPLSTALLILVGIEFLLGIAALFSVPAGRPSGWIPDKAATIYLLHAVVGLPLTIGAVALVVLVRGSARPLRAAGWVGFCAVAVAGIGGLLTASHGLRLFGMALMFVGPMVATFAYLIPLVEKKPAPT
jgi:hypothetical protein